MFNISTKTILLTTAICASLGFSATPALAVTDAEFEALKNQMSSFAAKLETLESEQTALRKENTILKQQNAALQTKNTSLEKNLNLTMDNLESQKISTDAAITATKSQIEKQSQALAEQVADINPAAGDAKDGMLIPGTDTRLKLGGYVKIDAIHDFNVSRDGNGEDFGLYAAIPLDGSAEQEKGGNTRVHARQTRINLTATTPTEYGDFKVFLEGDFLASQGSQNTTNRADFGLRHAYGELGPFVVGQTWSNYMDLAAYPDSLDFQGVSGNTLVRQGQIRYTHKPDNSMNSYSIAVENPSTEYLDDPAGSAFLSGVEEYPDVTAKARFVGDFGEVSLKGVARWLEVYNANTDNSDDDFGYAVAASGKIKAYDKDDFRFQLAYGEGIGRYIYDLAAGTQAAGFTSSNDSIETIEAWGGYVAYRHWWNDDLRSSIIGGTTQILDNPSFLNPATTNEHIYSAHGNLIWSVTDKIDIGGEYIFGRRETEDGSEGELHRAQLSAKYSF